MSTLIFTSTDQFQSNDAMLDWGASSENSDCHILCDFCQMFMFMFMPAKADPAVGRLTAMPLSTSQYGARPSIRRPMDTYHSRMHTIHTIQGCTRPASFPLGSPGRVFKVPLGRRDYWLLGLSSAGAGLSRPLHQCI